MAENAKSSSRTSSKANKSTNSRNRRDQISSVQIMFVTILAIGLMLTLNFNTRIAADRELEQVHERIVQEIELLEREQESLTTELNFVSSDAYVEAWARDEGKMVREGEVLVIPKPPAIVQQSVPIPQEAIASTFTPIQTTLPKPAPWQLWWSLFFDSAPPS